MLETRHTILFDLEVGDNGNYFLWVREDGGIRWMVQSWATKPSESALSGAVRLVKAGITICTKMLSSIKIVPEYIGPERPLVFPD